METSRIDQHRTLAHLLTEALALSDELGLGLVAISLETALGHLEGTHVAAYDCDAVH